MADGKYLSEIFDSIGMMFLGNALGSSMSESPLKQVRIENYVRNEDGYFTGNVDVSETVLAQYSWIKTGTPLQGNVKNDNEFSISIPILQGTFQFQQYQFEETSGTLILKNQVFGDLSNKKFISDIQVSMAGNLVVGETSYNVQVDFAPLYQSNKINIKVKFLDDSEKDCTSLLQSLFGNTNPMAQLTPWIVEYREQVQLDTLYMPILSASIITPSQILAERTNVIAGSSILLRIKLNLSQFKIGIKWIEFEELYLCFEYYSDSQQLNVDLIEGRIKLFGLLLDIRVDSPYQWVDVEVSPKEKILLTEIATKLSVSLPDFLRNKYLQQLRLRYEFQDNGYEFYLDVEDSQSSNLIELSTETNTTLTLAGLYIEVCGDADNITVSAEAVLLIPYSQSSYCSFDVQINWDNTATSFVGSIQNVDVPIKDLCVSLFGLSPKSNFPEITIKYLAIKGGIASGITVDELAGKLHVEMKDTSALGLAFSFDAEGKFGKNVLSLSGEFQFKDLFKVQATYAYEQSDYKWSFRLIAGKLSVGVQYDSVKGLLSGKVDSTYTLGNVTDGLLKLLNPSATFDRTGIWSFLDDISLNESSLSYNYAQEELQITLAPSVKKEFIQLDKLTISIKKTGVEFQVAGDFLGETYTSDNPLKFAPNDPPQVSAKGFSVNYLLFGTGISAPALSGTDVNTDMTTLHNAFNSQTKISELSVLPTAGSMFGVDVNVAQTLKVQLIYEEENSYCAGRFELYGDQAGALKGLSAELSYTKRSDNIGVFSGKFTPPKSLRTIRFGSMEIGLGNLAASIYSNGDYYLDLGYPHNGKFEYSFSFKYGKFTGRGGVYLQKNTGTQKNDLPTLSKGYYANIMQMGLGMLLNVGDSYSFGPVKATVNLTMTGLFHGTYAWVQKDANSGNEYYKLTAAVIFDGQLHGKVDFGLVGAAVSVGLHATLSMLLESGKAFEADLAFQLTANASVKICFVRIKFHFNLSSSIHLSFSNKTTLRRSAKLSLRQAQNSEKVTAHLSVVPVFTRSGSYPAVALMLFANATEFDRIVDQLATLLDNGNAMDTDTMELFASKRLTTDIDQMLALLASAFNFVIDGMKINAEKSGSAESSGGTEEEGVLIPLPEWVNLVLRTYYNNGYTDCAERNLSTYETMSDEYLHTVETYYSDMIPADNALTVDEHGIAAYIFTDFFELVMKAIRAEKESALLNDREFDVKALTPEQHANIRGVSARFSLGGRRAPRKSGPAGVEGLMRIAGEQIDFFIPSTANKLEFEIQKLDTLPSWITFADNQDKFNVSMDVAQVNTYLPIAKFGSDIFALDPQCMPYYQEVEEGVITLQKLFTAGKYTVFEVPKQLKNGESYIISTPEFNWGCTLETKLQRESGNSGLYRVQIDMVRMAKCTSCKAEIYDVAFLYQTNDGYVQWSPSDKSSVACIADLKMAFSGTNAYADLSDAKAWIDEVCLSSETEGGCLWSLPSDCPFAGQDEITIKTVILFSGCDMYYDCWDLFYSINAETAFTSFDKTTVQTIGQGTACITANIDLTKLSDEQTKLYGLYGGMGAEILDTSDTVISSESPSYFAENGDSQDKFTIPIPYVKALKQSNNIYLGVAEKTQYQFKLFHTDVLGNRIDTGKVVSFVPKYHDRLMSLADFPGLSCKGTLVTSATGTQLTLTLESTVDLSQNDEAKTRFQSGYNQYAMTDVSLNLQGTLFSQNQAVDKQALLMFLSGLIDGSAPSKSMSLTYSVSIDTGKVKLQELACNIVVSRSADLCENMDFVKTASSGVLIDSECSSDSAACTEILFADEQQYLLTGKKESLLKLSKAYFYGFRPLPVVSGSFTKDSEKIQINNLNTRGVFDQYLSDLEFLTSADRMAAYYAVEELRPYMNRILTLKKKTAEVMAGKVTPLYQYDIADAEKAKMQETAKAFFAKNLFVNRKDIVFAQLQCNLNQMIENKFSIIGTVGGGSGFPSAVDLSVASPILNCALDVSEDFYTSDIDFKPRYVVVNDSEKRLSVKNENSPLFQNILLQGNSDSKAVLPVLQKAPVVPIIAAANSELDSCTVDLRLVMTSEDTVLVKLLAEQTARRLKAALNNDADILAMEEYRCNGGAYLLGNTTEDRKKIVELMESYIEALEDFDEIPQGMSGGYALSFVCDEAGLGKKLKCDIDDATLEISLSEDGYTWRKTTKNGCYYEDTDGVILGQGFYIRIKKAGTGLKHGSFQMKKSKGFVQGETCDVSPKHIMYSTIVSF